MFAGPFGILLSNQRQLAALAGESDRPSGHAPSVASLLQGGVVQPAAGREPVIKPAMAIMCKLNAALIRARSIIMRHAAVAS